MAKVNGKENLMKMRNKIRMKVNMNMTKRMDGEFLNGSQEIFTEVNTLMI